jgi:preprotein translocase subunit SecF
MTYYGFYNHRRLFFSISLLLIVLGILAFILNGVQLDIQFKGGAILKYSYTGTLNADTVADFTAQKLDRLVSAQETKDLTTGETRVALQLSGEYGMSATQQDELNEALAAQFPGNAITSVETSLVEPFFGARFLQRGILAILLAVVLILVYEWITFRKIGGLAAGITALAALLHDLLMVFFTCVIARIPIGDTFVAVALSIIGYSINDTIVIFDRIRENRAHYPKESIERVADLSIRQSMMRSVNTNVAVTLSVALIYFFASRASLESIISFALPMLIGSISGCYSTLCLAGPLWVMWQKRKAKAMAAVAQT